MLIDTHAHPEQVEFDNDRDRVLVDTFKSGIESIIAVGTSIANTKKIINLSEKHKNIFPTAGIHPTDGLLETKDKDKYKREFEKLVKKNKKKIVAVGECGLDIYFEGERQTSTEELFKQIELFEFQLQIAKKYNLPVVIHCRNGWNNVFELLDKNNINNGVFHCWTGSLEQLKQAEIRGFYVAFGGILTFKNAGEIVNCAKKIDINKLVLETDSPFLAPEGLRGKRNEPKNVRIVAEFVARLRGVELSYIEEVTTKNAKKLFGI